MILSLKPLALSEVPAYIPNLEEKKELAAYFKQFSKLSPEKAAELKDALQKLNNVKIKEEYVAKIVDVLPRSNEDINKIFHDVSLNEEEINTILGIVKDY